MPRSNSAPAPAIRCCGLCPHPRLPCPRTSRAPGWASCARPRPRACCCVAASCSTATGLLLAHPDGALPHPPVLAPPALLCFGRALPARASLPSVPARPAVSLAARNCALNCRRPPRPAPLLRVPGRRTLHLARACSLSTCRALVASRRRFLSVRPRRSPALGAPPPTSPAGSARGCPARSPVSPAPDNPPRSAWATDQCGPPL
nr:uncharacterized protein DKFZp434B061-like [Aegilops tauschii subsp. strangulata]